MKVTRKSGFYYLNGENYKVVIYEIPYTRNNKQKCQWYIGSIWVDDKQEHVHKHFDTVTEGIRWLKEWLFIKMI